MPYVTSTGAEFAQSRVRPPRRTRRPRVRSCRPAPYPQWLVALHAPDLRPGSLLVGAGAWSSGGLAASGDDETPDGSRVEMAFERVELCERD